MRNRQAVIFALVAMACGFSAQAATRDPSARLMSPTFVRCMDQAEGVMGRMLRCLAGETDRQEELLNRNYEAALSAGPAHAMALRVRQRAWLKRQEAKCKVDPEGGFGAIADASDCNLTETALKAEELRRLVRRR